MTDDDGINVKLRSWASVKPALLTESPPGLSSESAAFRVWQHSACYGHGQA